eukprot:gene26369-32942_t
MTLDETSDTNHQDEALIVQTDIEVAVEKRARDRDIRHSPDRFQVQAPILPGPASIETMIKYLGFDAIARDTGLRVFKERNLQGCIRTLQLDTMMSHRAQVERMYEKQVTETASKKPTKVDPYDINAWLNIKPVQDPYAQQQQQSVVESRHSRQVSQERSLSPISQSAPPSQRQSQYRWSRRDLCGVEGSDGEEVEVGHQVISKEQQQKERERRWLEDRVEVVNRVVERHGSDSKKRKKRERSPSSESESGDSVVCGVARD